MEIGKVPSAEALAKVQVFKEWEGSTPPESPGSGALSFPGGLLESILKLLAPEGSQTPQDWVFVGEGLPTVPKCIHKRVPAWEFVNLAELWPYGALESLQQESGQQNVLVIHDLQVTRARIQEVGERSEYLDPVLHIIRSGNG